MNGYEMRIHVNSLLAVLGEILAEVKGLREDYAEGRTVMKAASSTLVIDSLYNKKYEG
jgi:hypothetical protein